MFMAKIVIVHTRANCNRILLMLRITNQQNLLLLCYRTALSVPKVPACEQYYKIL